MGTISAVVLILMLSSSVGLAQPDSVVLDSIPQQHSNANETGYLLVTCDSSGIDIYVDEMLVGQAPLLNPIPLPPGKHTVSYLQPEFLSLLHQYHKEGEIQDLISKGLQTVYVVPGQTIPVNLWWTPYARELKARKTRFWIRSLVGVALVTVLLTLNVLVSS